ncbi:MAG: type II secretion system protein [Phycisphaerae bacterium]|jgi:prepilin-type N-terminal cleavage/methylation domain-containing protein/prepilin-type processing-associated H-X9-DG protein|nr:type II secretion system protein [Phycisphaerae bacterium]
MKTPIRRRSGGFTLIELLIVIAILGVLIGLLAPALRAAWDAVLTLKCQNNMGQLCKAMLSFAADHDNRLPGGSWDPVSLEWLGNPYSRGSLGGNLWRTPQEGSLFPYVKDERVYVCPKDQHISVEETRSQGGPPPLEAGSGLGNGRFSYSIPQVVIGASASLLAGFGTEYTDIEGRVHRMSVPILIEEGEFAISSFSTDGSWGNGDAFADRHRGGCNIGYIDTHVEWFGWQDIQPDMNSFDLILRTPKGTRSFGNGNLSWENSLNDWYASR